MIRWQFWIDRGGTFTDIVARRPDGSLVTMKLLSENPERYEDAAVEGIGRILSEAGDGDGKGGSAPIDASRVEAVKMGTTVATNALLERKGEPLLLLVTAGFADALRIAYQNRPRLFDRRIVLPEALESEVAEVRERVAHDGEVIEPLDEEGVREVLAAARARGLRALAVVLMHGFRYPAHERRIGELAREAGFTQVSLSHQVSPLIKFVSRGDTTVVDAYLSPVLRRYVDRVAAAMPGVRLQFMQSSGGLTDAHVFQGKDSILSGPAGGIVGMARVSRLAGFERVIGFDMGGTSTDVSHFAGELERAFDSLVAGVRVRAPMLSIHTVAAGGGSILHFDGARLRVGPDSAGANPGPTCYRRGGPLTVTDANVMLGRIQPGFFPSVFGPDGRQPLDRDAVVAGFTRLADEIAQATGTRLTPEAVAQGFIDIAIGNMANAIKKISVQRGYDVTRYTLVTFGGAGGQHACGVADALGMPTVLAHPLAGVLSAYGMGLAEQSAIREHSVEAPLDDSGLAEASRILAGLVDAARAELVQQGESPEAIRLMRRALLRYLGTDTAIEVPFDGIDAMRADFERIYRQRFSFLMSDRPLVIDSVVAEAMGPSGEGARLDAGPPRSGELAPMAVVPLYAADQWHDAPLYRREDIDAGESIEGPAIIVEATATTVIDPGWRARMTDRGDLVIDRHIARPERVAIGTQADPIMLEIFNNLFMSAAEQMGYRLQNTAHSVNIKERLDFSCAVFDAGGALVANAPHMPVHLGSMGASVRAVIASNPADSIRPGDVFVLNDPYAGGTHLPDVTVISPVFDHAGREILFWVGSRGHHADIGGLTPGSMPPDSRTIEDEGVLITNFRLVSGGRIRDAEMLALLTGARHPARNPDQNLADLRAQVAANEKGREELLRMVDQFGLEVVRAYMRHVQDNAEESVRRAISALRDGDFRLRLDNGAEIRVALRVDPASRSAKVDFTGTSAQLPNNFNAPRAVTMAAVLYVFRTLVDDDIPMNEGCLKPIEVVVPRGCMLAPEHPAAVVAGNVETSSCIVAALYGALGVMASAQPTMNNLTFGTDRFQYYETIAGGSGAGGIFDADGVLVDGFDGCAAVQTHMTNSRITDPEVLETRFPVRVLWHRIRRGSGGAGRWRGGDGASRGLRLLEPMTVSILSNGRYQPAFGAAGGEPGAPGINRLVDARGNERLLGPTDSAQVEAGATIIIETPGGGGYGKSVAGD